MSLADKLAWRMRHLLKLRPAELSLLNRVWLVILRIYLVAAVALVIYKVTLIALHRGLFVLRGGSQRLLRLVAAMYGMIVIVGASFVAFYVFRLPRPLYARADRATPQFSRFLSQISDLRRRRGTLPFRQ